MLRYAFGAQLRFRGNARRGQQESRLYEWNLEISEMFYQHKVSSRAPANEVFPPLIGTKLRSHSIIGLSIGRKGIDVVSPVVPLLVIGAGHGV